VKRLSSGMTVWTRTIMPVWWGIIFCGLVAVTRGRIGLPGVLIIAAGAVSVWFGRHLSDVWLDGDVLQVQGPTGSFRGPLSDVLLLDDRWGRQRFCVLLLDHPVGKVQKVRFIPEGDWVVFGPNPADALEKDLRSRIHAARAARGAVMLK
jgi:hypothetical protein